MSTYIALFEIDIITNPCPYPDFVHLSKAPYVEIHIRHIYPINYNHHTKSYIRMNKSAISTNLTLTFHYIVQIPLNIKSHLIWNKDKGSF